jgi:hypothetical protein
MGWEQILAAAIAAAGNWASNRFSGSDSPGGNQGFPGYGPSGGGPPTREGLYGSLAGDMLTGQEDFMGSLMGNLAAPISMADSRVEPVQGYAGGALPFRIGADAIDPAFRQPEMLVNPGWNLAGLHEPQPDPNNQGRPPFQPQPDDIMQPPAGMDFPGLQPQALAGPPGVQRRGSLQSAAMAPPPPQGGPPQGVGRRPLAQGLL